VERVRGGEREAFGELVDRHGAAVYRTALAALGSARDAEDVAQEALVTAFRKIHSFRGEASFRTWLLTIAWRQALGRRRRLGILRRRFVDLDATPSGLESRVASSARSQEAGLIQAELAGHVRRLVAKLPAKLRHPLLLSASGDHGYEEMAQMLGVPAGTLKWRVAEARRRLKERLVGLGYGDA
jgi:RNA polymerase sigma-70 factor (ECF subfamily)